MIVGVSTPPAAPRRAAPLVVVALALHGCFHDTPNVTSAATISAGTTAESTSSTSLTSGATDLATSAEATTASGTSAEATSSETTDASTGDTSTTGEAPSTCPSEQPGLVLCYSFEGDVSTVIVDSSASNYAGITASVGQGPGRFGEALVLGPRSVVRVASNDAIFAPLADAFTIAAWVAPELPALADEAGVISRAGDFELALVRVGGEVGVRCTAGDSIVVSEAIPFAEWTHVACVCDGVTLAVVVDGLPLAKEAVALISGVPHDLLLGNIGPMGTPERALIGGLDEVQLWSVALEGAELCLYAGIAGC